MGVNQSAEEDTVKLSWAPWPCPKKGPWPAPPLCGEGRIELQYDVNQSEFEPKEDNVKLFPLIPVPTVVKKAVKKAVAAAKTAAKKVAAGKACIDASVKAGIKVGGKICVR